VARNSKSVTGRYLAAALFEQRESQPA